MCTTAWQTANTGTEDALRSDVCHTSLFAVWGFVSDRVTGESSHPKELEGLKGILNLVSDSLRNAEEKVHLKKSLRWFFFATVSVGDCCD